jgi:hypothetical protein
MPRQAFAALTGRTSSKPDGIALVFVLALLIAAGCGRGKELRPAPPTYPVSGEVKPGGKVPAGAQVEFRPSVAEKANDFTARAVIDAAGKFSLNTPFIDRVLPGAIEGDYTVRILFPSSNNPNAASGSGFISISEKFTVKPTENHFTITIRDQP